MNTVLPLSVLCVGEEVVDLFGTEVPDTFIRLMGGSPGNTATGLVKLGLKATVFAAVGATDPHGKWIIDQMQCLGVDTTYVAKLGVPTTQSWISIDPDTKNRSFSFVPAAHDQITDEHVRAVDYTQFAVMHMTSVLQANPNATTAIDTMLDLCAENGVLVSFDPNLRPTLWGDTERMVGYVRATLPKADIVKVSDEELAILLNMPVATFTGTDAEISDSAIDRAVRKLFGGKNQIFVVTLGARGAFWKTRTGFGSVLTISVDVVDTTGAGDAFDAGLINGLAAYIAGGVLNVPDGDVPQIVRRACVFASLSTRAKGAVAGLPTQDELNQNLSNLNA